jgi:hypothetical protein
MLGLVKSDISRFLKASGGVKYLSNDELVEVCLVLLSTKHEYEDGLAYLQMVRDRGVCFSEFYNFAKNKWNPKYLVNFMAKAKTNEKVFSFWRELNDKAIVRGFAENSAPRQKGRVFSVLYAYYFQKYSFSDVSLDDVSALHSLIKDKHPLFAGERPSSEYDQVRKDLAGILFFLEEGYSANSVATPSNLAFEIIPEYLIKTRGRSLSASKRKVEDIDASRYPFIVKSMLEHKQTLALKSTKECDASFRALLTYIRSHLQIDKVETVDDFRELIVVGRTGDSRWLHYLEKVVKKSVRSKALYVRDYLIWLMLENAIDIDDGYEPLLSRLETERVMRMQGRDGGTKDETPKAVIPYRVHQLATEILHDSDYKWAKTLPHLYFENEYGESVFNPTISNLMAVLFSVPIRGIQAQCLDSGEGDPFKFNFAQSHWEPNDGKHASYWKAKGSSNRQRGFLCRDQTLVSDARKAKDFNENGEPIVRRAYMYINTNKTADRSVAFSDNSGYTIPWHQSEVISIVQRQLAFLNKHHPVSKPSNFTDIDSKEIKQILGADPTEAVKKLIPSRFYLFRCNLNPERDSWDFPPTKVLMIKTWNALMLEIQKRLDEEGVDYSVVSQDKMEKFKNNIGGGNSYISYLTIHCTRVTGITRLEEAGVPINIISKFIAGHANIRTTYRYTKHDREYVHQQITDAQSTISRNMQMSLSSDLKKVSVEEAKEMAYIPDIYSTSWEAVKERAWNSNILGICPNAGTLCDQALKDNEFIFKGVGKCLNCIYLVSGKPYLISIWSHINALMYKAKKINDVYVELQNEYKTLIRARKAEYKARGKSEKWHVHSQNLERIENHMESNSDEENMILAEVYYGNMLFETVRELTNTDDDFVEGLGFEQCLEFEHLNSIVESDAFVPHFNRDKDLKFKRDTFVDMALVALGEQPIFLKPLTEEEREAAISSVAKAIEHDLRNKEGKYLGAAMQIQELSGGVQCIPK